MHSPRDHLRVYAAKHRLRVKPCNVMYPYRGEVARAYVRNPEDRVTFRAATKMLVGELDCDTALLFSINDPEPALGIIHRSSFQFSGHQFVVFSPGPLPDDSTTIAPLFWQELVSYRLRTCESVHVARNRLTLFFSPDRDIDHTAGLLRRLTAAIALETLPATRPEAATLPQFARSLEKYFGAWAIEDDEKRAEAVRRATPEELQSLICEVVPLLPLINRLLSESEHRALTESEQKLGRLAEVTAEILAARG